MRVYYVQKKFTSLTIIYKGFYSMDNVSTYDILCIFTRSSCDTEIVRVPITYFKSYAN